jgi:outer membrane protein TolC
MLREQQLDLDRDEATRRSQLSSWIGSDAAAVVAPSGIGPSVELPPLALLQARLVRHPSQVDFERRIEAAHTSVDLAREQRKPSWMLDFGYGFRKGAPDGMQRPDMLSAMVTVDLPLFRGNRQDREVAAAHLEEEGLHALHEGHRREMTAMLEEAWNMVHRTSELERFYESELLPLADQSVTAALLAWRSNRGMFDDVVTARRLALETRLKHLRLGADRAIAQHDIDYLVGNTP